ncbi:MAG: DnaJ domain-containing protein [Acaryochloridaceae cyanobacterium RU_4_10]|nr:DnaJ domain-containing protein [Acaryochloridaceae cyanobacterium RU_4_10]
MKESKESYYDVLGLTDRCTKEDIKRAYIELCKNYHPDKLPSETPEGARKFIAERMALINEAYEVLKDEVSRKSYNISINSRIYENSQTEYKSNYQEHRDPSRENSIEDLLEQSILEDALKQLEFEEKQFDQIFRASISTIEKKYSKHLKTIKKHVPGSFDIVDSSMKLEKSIGYGFAAFIALWLVPLGYALSFVGWLLLIVFGILFIQTISSPVYRSDYVKEVKEAKAKRDIGVVQFKASINGRINYFKGIPIHSINYGFVRELSSRDRLLLVKALKQREDAEQAEKSVQSTIKVAAAIGLLAIFLGSISS